MQPHHSFAWRLTTALIASVSMIVAVGFIYFKRADAEMRKNLTKELEAITDNKVLQIIDWREERLNAGRAVMQNPLIGEPVQRFLRNQRDAVSTDRMQRWLQTIQERHLASQAVLVDADCAVHLAFSAGMTELNHTATTATKKAIAANQVTMSDLHRDALTGKIQLDLIIPILAPDESQISKATPIGAVILELSPEQFLYPLIQSWPSVSSSAEVLLIRREGDDVLFLNELRHRKGTALSLRLPILKGNLPAAMAANGKTGLVEGLDYRGVPVLASVSDVPGTNWFMVAKVDRHEAYAVLRMNVLMAIVISSLLLIAFNLGFGLIRRQGKLRFYREQAERDNEARRMATVVREITERKLVEEEVRKLNTKLEKRVVERTVQLEAANKELESFSYSVSHDLRAPLRHVQGYVDMLSREAEGHLSDKSQHYMKTIQDASREMGILIDDLLAFSRMGRADMTESKVNLNSLVNDMVSNLKTTTPDRNIIWKIQLLPDVQADPAMLRQVLTNLLSNAMKFTGPRDPAEIEIGCMGTENGRITIFIRDNGVGFDPQYTHKLFGVFQRLHRADEFEGTGIGLANVRRIITRQGGRVWAESKINEGATFYFTLKLSP